MDIQYLSNNFARLMVDPICGIYFLIKDAETVYIGQSINIVQRVVNHTHQKDFDFAYFIKIPANMLDDAEAYLIRKYTPKLNSLRLVKKGNTLSERIVLDIEKLIHAPMQSKMIPKAIKDFSDLTDRLLNESKDLTDKLKLMVD